jgi:hypothetical protein
MRDTPAGALENPATAAEILGGGEMPVIFPLLPVEVRTDLRSVEGAFDPDLRDGSARVTGEKLGVKDFKLDLSVGDKLFAALSLSCIVEVAEP